MKRTVVLLLVATLGLGGSSMAWAQTADPPAPSPEREARKAAAKACREQVAATKDRDALKACLGRAGIEPRPGGPGKLRRRSVHGEHIVKGRDGTFRTVQVDRGTVGPATTATRIVVVRRDGVTVTLALTAETRYRGIDGAAAIRQGEPAQVISEGGTALGVRQKAAGNKAPGPVVPRG